MNSSVTDKSLRDISPQTLTFFHGVRAGKTTEWPTHCELQGWGPLQICLAAVFLRGALHNTPSTRLNHHKAKDGDVLIHACLEKKNHSLNYSVPKATHAWQVRN